MGPCKICKKPGGYGFQPPGTRAQRKAHWIAWACDEHRSEVEAQWSAHVKEHNLTPEPDPKQGELL